MGKTENFVEPLRVCAVIVSFGRPDLLKRCVMSLLDAMSYGSPLELKLRVLINGTDRSSTQAMMELNTTLPFGILTLEELSNSVTPASARNRCILIEQNCSAPADWFFFIDDDAYVPHEHFSVFLDSIKNISTAAVLGGPNLTPPGASLFQKASGSALGCPLGTHVSFARYRSYGKVRICDETALILCNLFVHSKCLEGELFKEDLVCAEENRLLQVITQKGLQSFYHPDLYVWHERRANIQQFAAQVFKYGYGRGQTIRQRPLSAKYFHVLPSILVVGIVFCLCFLISPVVINFGYFYLLLCLGFVGYLAAHSDLLDGQKRIIFLTPFLFPVIHLFYGLGVLSGFAQRLKRG